jgi:gliding motility-associated-like protein
MKKIFLILTLFGSLQIIAQGEAANWYFGFGAGLQFNQATGNTTVLFDGQLSTNEGCSSISDANGNLLFYSDGVRVWNRNHQIMPNGTGLFGDPSSTQSALVVPKPDDPNIYYIFTVDTAAVDGTDFGLNYSIVDMSLDNGLGDIVNKNINLLADCSEKITAVLKDCVTKSIWVMTLASIDGTSNVFNTYHAFEVNNAGVNTTSVKSTFSISVSDQRGYLKLSPDGTKMICANMRGDFNDPNSTDQLLLYDFNETTGVVSNQQRLFINSPNKYPYGVEFSPNSQVLYVHSSNDLFGSGANNSINHSAVLTQFNLAATDIQASEFPLDIRQLYRGGLQLGPNGKIYRALSATYTQGLPFLGVINNPNNIGAAANYQHNAISLTPNLSSQGFPPFIQSIFNTEVDIIRNGISVTNLSLCDGDTYTLMADDIVGATYTWTLDGNPLPNTVFDLTITQGGLYEVLIDLNNGDCPIEGKAIVSYFTPPIANQPTNINICDDDNDSLYDFDFTTNVDAQVLNTQDPLTYSVHYFETATDAVNNTNEIVIPYQNTTNPQEIFVRIHNDGFTDCFDTTSFFIEIFDTPTANPVGDWEICDNNTDGSDVNGQRDFDLTTLNALVLGTQDPLQYNVTYHNSQADADAGANVLPNPYYNTTPNLETIFVRIENIVYPDCFDTASFNLIVNIIPDAFNTTLFQCDEDGNPDGFTLFNLTEANDALTGGIADRSTKFFLTLADAQNDTNEIDGTSFSNTISTQIIYVQVINDSTGCFRVSQLTLDVTATDATDAILTHCDDDGAEDGFYNFDLSLADATILTNLPNTVTLSYYETFDDSLLEVNNLGTTFTNTIPYSQTIYARIENANACYGIAEVQLTVYEIPNIETEFETIYCLNTIPETITLDSGLINNLPSDFAYLWSTGETTESIQINAPGTYSVTVTNANNCNKTRNITVIASNIATFENIEVIDVSSNNTITVIVSGEGDYEYALNNINGPYQDSNFFENVPPGLHTVFVRDRKNCGIVNESVSVIGFPKFFTPNGDGFHDTWQVYGINHSSQIESIIYIFDRYGKLLKQLSPQSLGWDGTFNGEDLPSSDYWFHLKLPDGRIFKSHFSLKR